MTNHHYEASWAHHFFADYVRKATGRSQPSAFLLEILDILQNPQSRPDEHTAVTTKIVDVIAHTLLISNTTELYIDCNIVVEILIDLLKDHCSTQEATAVT